ncbi:hypothetical protein N7478_011085 [Penicillium angulare]|uniref:uncharacterized protein n=1 Tax=Penicillium angulare TaxID=116970 RepID=UPI00254091E5|nr:uncharacterized protein N7478_011085 [Penicillium angulare]KAJ5263480.1 hypothetical protein N7478_011085 [Penicillium angulare]
MSDLDSGRLPTTVRPIHYDLTLEPDLENFVFHGCVKIKIDVLRGTNSITLHVVDLAIHDVWVSDTEIPSSKVRRDEEKHILSVYLDEPLVCGQTATISLKFKGILEDKLAGFFRSSYTDDNGHKQFIAVTHMEPTYARRVFPCFDDPALKATFAVTVRAAEKFTCLSNMDIKSSRSLGNGKKQVVFSETPPMSTYLVTVVVGDLVVLETDSYRVPVRLFAVAGTELDRLGAFGLDLSVRTLDFYDSEFDSPYPLPKLDMVAVPDFTGAMENWGLVLYNDARLLFDPISSPVSYKQQVTMLVLHELAHQWFGNLVTMEYWDGLWLNEGFAEWMSCYACNVFHPEWDVWKMFVAGDLQRGLALDALRSSHPVQTRIHGDSDIGQIFDDISYTKGSCILIMIARALGEDSFLRGVRAYLRRHAYSNARTEDLWIALSETSSQDAVNIMEIWTRKVGFPVLTVTEDEESKTIHIRQSRFLSSGDLEPDEDETIYPVPLAFHTTNNDIDMDIKLRTREATFNVTTLDFFKLNANHSGFYRTAYSPERLKKLGQVTNSPLFTAEDHVGLIADAAALAAAGYQKTSSVLGLLDSINQDTEYIVWSQMLASIAAIHAAWIQVPQIENALNSLECQLIGTKAHHLGWAISDNDSDITRRFKTLLFYKAALAGDEKVKKSAEDMFRQYRAGDQSAIHPDLREAVFASMISTGGEDEYDAILDLYYTARTSNERAYTLAALGHARNPEMIRRTTTMLLNEVRLHEIIIPLTTLSTHLIGISAIWDWFTSNWPVIKERLVTGLVMLGRVIQLCTKGFTTEERWQEVRMFFQNSQIQGLEKSVQRALDEIRTKSRWVKRDSKDVTEWLEDTVVKFSWRYDEEPIELRLLQRAQERNAWGVIQFQGYQDLVSIAELRQGLEFPQPFVKRTFSSSIRNVAIKNLIITTQDSTNSPKGVLLDFNFVLDLDHVRPIEPMVGSDGFMAIGILTGQRHTYRHDLESLFYVFLWIAIANDHIHNEVTDFMQGLPETSRLPKWCTMDFGAVGRDKSLDMSPEGFEEILNEFSSEFAPLRGLAKELHALISPVRGGQIFTGTDTDLVAVQNLYDGMADAFNRSALAFQK